MTNSTRILLLVVTLSLAACGFHLRGSNPSDVAFAFKSLYLKAPGETPFVTELRRTLKAYKITLTNSADEAELVLEITEKIPPKQILSLNRSGQVQEYQLEYRVLLRAYDNKQNDWLPADDISMSRILPYDVNLVLSKVQEEALLYKDMRNDAVGQAMRRLNRAKPQVEK
jgi:LPS-assembly lipoprotein